MDGFGVIFTGNEVNEGTFLEFFDINNNKIHEVSAPVAGDACLSFAGTTFDSATIARVTITAGTLGVDQCAQEDIVGFLDCVAMDNFIAGEMQPVVNDDGTNSPTASPTKKPTVSINAPTTASPATASPTTSAPVGAQPRTTTSLFVELQPQGCCRNANDESGPNTEFFFNRNQTECDALCDASATCLGYELNTNVSILITNTICQSRCML